LGQDSVPALVKPAAGETLRWTFVVLPGTSCELLVEFDLDGPGIEVDIAGIYLCRADESVRLNIMMKHNSGGCTSRQLFKGLVGGAASAEFDGLVYVKQDAMRTEAHQENHNILLSERALVETRPQLEIYADDVVCSHGATTGYLNPDELFYMRSRGVPEAEALRLQMVSFVAPVVSRLPDNLQEMIYDSLY